MDILSNLQPAEGSIKKGKRIGRGQGSGRGGTSTKGDKGQKSRSGYSRKRHHEGGQTPIQMRLPKRGFNNINRVEYVPLNLEQLQYIADKHNLASIDFDTLRKFHLVKKGDKVKVLAKGELTKAINVKLHACSKAAKEAIEAQGGTIETI